MQSRSLLEKKFQYRKLPGHRRGFLRGASIWVGPDHLLLVRSLRFREEYKRYYFRDIQAIVTAKAPRWQVSTPVAAIATLLLVAWPFAFQAQVRTGISFPGMLGGAALALVVAWFVVSGFFSCRCRIYTAVSSDDLSSLYRTWTARKFLRIVEPLIQQTQGSFDPSWMKALGERNIGPAETGAAVKDSVTERAAFPLVASAALIASLFADAIWNSITLHSVQNWPQVGNGLLTLAEAGAAIAVIVLDFRVGARLGKDYRSRANIAMQRLAIATLAAIAVFFFLQPFAVGFIAAVRTSTARQQMPIFIGDSINTLRQIDAILAAVTGVVGLAIILSRNESNSGIIYPSS